MQKRWPVEVDPIKEAFVQAAYLLRNCTNKEQALVHAQWALLTTDTPAIKNFWRLVIIEIKKLTPL